MLALLKRGQPLYKDKKWLLFMHCVYIIGVSDRLQIPGAKSTGGWWRLQQGSSVGRGRGKRREGRKTTPEEERWGEMYIAL